MERQGALEQHNHASTRRVKAGGYKSSSWSRLWVNYAAVSPGSVFGEERLHYCSSPLPLHHVGYLLYVGRDNLCIENLMVKEQWRGKEQLPRDSDYSSSSTWHHPTPLKNPALNHICIHSHEFNKAVKITPKEI